MIDTSDTTVCAKSCLYPCPIASLYGFLQRITEAQDASQGMFHKAIEMNPTYTKAYFNLGKNIATPQY